MSYGCVGISLCKFNVLGNFEEQAFGKLGIKYEKREGFFPEKISSHSLI